MTPEEEDKAYAESLECIHEAEHTGATTLNLTYLDSRRLPQELGRLTSIKELYLTGCDQLNDLTPISGLTWLEKFYFFMGHHVKGDLAPLAALISLKELVIIWCPQLTGDLSPLAGLTSLQEICLSMCDELNGDLAPLAALTSLRSLDLGLCKKLMGDLKPLTGLTSLRKLKLSGLKQLSDLSPLVDLTSLQELDLRRCGQLRDLSPLVGLTSLEELDLSECGQLSDLSPLVGLTSLRNLDLSECGQLSDLSPLVGLTSLWNLDLSECGQLGDLSPLVGLTSLRILDLAGCRIRRFVALECLLPALEILYLHGCKADDLPSEIYGETVSENVLDKVRAHYRDLRSGQQIDAEVKVLFLGNGGAGKTQLYRRLCDLPFDPSVSTTHGIQLGEMAFGLEGYQEPVRLNLWDFGGQDIYHGSHALFLHGQAIFLLLWTPELECQTAYQEGTLFFRHRPLSYWLDYVRNFAGTDASVLIVQSQCDTRDKRILHPPAPVDDFPFHRYMEVSARTGLNLGILKENIKEAVRDRFDLRPPSPIGAGRSKVRDRLRQMLEEDQKLEPGKRQRRWLERAEFDRLCDEAGGISDKEALLDFLHHNGVVFHRRGLFGNRIILDQNWALEAIYALFDRKKVLPLLQGDGRFTRAKLESLIWSDYTAEEQKIFLEMMEDCGICFRVRALPDDSHVNQMSWRDKEWEYIAPELLLTRSEAQKSVLAGRIPKGQPMAEAEARYSFLHEGVLRGYLSRIGTEAGDAAIYWKYGCWFYEETTDSRVLIEGLWNDPATETGSGSIRLRAWGANADRLMDPLLEALRKLPVGRPPEIKLIKTIGAQALVRSSASVTVRLLSASPFAQPPDIVEHTGSKHVDKPAQIKLEDLIFARDPIMKENHFFISYTKADKAWAEWIAWTLEAAGYSTVIQAWDFRPGSNFVLEMQRAATEANRTIAVLSQKYLESAFTQPEWAAAFAQDPQGQKQKLIPVRIEDCQLAGILAPIVYLDLVGLPENDARTALLGAFSIRNKPASAPAFPGAQGPRVSSTEPAYPGTAKVTSEPVVEALLSKAESVAHGAHEARLSAIQSLQFMQRLNALAPQHFNMLVIAVKPPPGLIPPMPAPQGDRTAALLNWAEGTGGCGVSMLRDLLEILLNPQ
jgi:internalin A